MDRSADGGVPRAPRRDPACKRVDERWNAPTAACATMTALMHSAIRTGCKPSVRPAAWSGDADSGMIGRSRTSASSGGRQRRDHFTSHSRRPLLSDHFCDAVTGNKRWTFRRSPALGHGCSTRAKRGLLLRMVPLGLNNSHSAAGGTMSSHSSFLSHAC